MRVNSLYRLSDVFCCGLALLCFAGLTVEAQSTLTSGIAVPVLLEPATGNQLLNGVRGFRITVPADAVRVTVRFENFTPDTPVDLYVRLGSEVVNGTNGSFVADSSATGTSADKIALLHPAVGGEVFIALRQPVSTNRVVGRLRATVASMLTGGTSVTIPSISQLMLAGAKDGTSYSYIGDSAPISTPVSVPVRGGQAIQISARGQVQDIVFTGNLLRFGGPWSPEGREYVQDFAAYLDGINGLGDFRGRIGALIGVFTGNALDANAKPWPYTFTNDAGLNTPVLRTALQQPFHVGSGLTTDGEWRTLIVPPGATQLHLGVAGWVKSSSGNFRATIRTVPVPETAVTSSVLRVPSRSQLMLAGAPDGFSWGDRNDVSPLHSPPFVAVTAGQTIQIRSSGTINMINGANYAFGPEGWLYTNGNGHGVTGWRGISGYRGYVASLIGVFTGNALNANATPVSLDFTGAGFRALQTVRPLLQQQFLIGSGLTPDGDSKAFVVPAGATRLYLGIAGTTALSNGEFYVTVNPDLASAPKISPGGFANGGGFAGAPFSPGSILSIFGANFGSQQVASATPLPTSLSDTQVWFNATPAPLYFVSPGQINVQIPPQLGTADKVQVSVTRGGIASQAVMVDLAAYRPGVFTAGGSTPILINAVTGALVSDTSPAFPGDYLLFYASGVGPLAPAVPDGVVSPSAPLARAIFPTEVIIQSGGKEFGVEAAFAGLAPGFVGVFQVNFQLPTDLPAGSVQLRIQSPPYGGSNTVNFPVRAR